MNHVENFVNFIRAGFGAIGAGVGYALGGVDDFIICLVVFVVVDYISGVILAIHKHELSSKIGYKGIARKVLIFILVGLTSLLDAKVLREGAAMRTAVIFFYIANEGLSILENCAELGLPIPQKLKDVLLSLQHLE